MKTISRSATRQIAALKEQLTDCKVYTLENYFAGNPVEPRHAWDALGRYHQARLTDKEDGTGTHTISIHSNCWYELRPATAEEASS